VRFESILAAWFDQLQKKPVIIELVEMWPIMDGFDKLTVHDRPGNLGVRCLETA
jgi:hypothetical protein